MCEQSLTIPCSHVLLDEQGMEALAQIMAAQCLEAGQLICLHGTLGAGKSSFCRAFVKAACDDEKMFVPSPTFTLVQPYETEKKVTLYHADLYRAETLEELDAIGLWDMMDEGCMLVEWPERLGDAIPESTWHVLLEMSEDEGTRVVTVVRQEA